MSCRQLQGVKITGFNGLERPHIRTPHFEKWEFEESKGWVKGGLLSEMFNFSYLGKGWEDLRIPGMLLFHRARVKWTPSLLWLPANQVSLKNIRSYASNASYWCIRILFFLGGGELRYFSLQYNYQCHEKNRSAQLMTRTSWIALSERANTNTDTTQEINICTCCYQSMQSYRQTDQWQKTSQNKCLAAKWCERENLHEEASSGEHESKAPYI